MTPPTMAPTFDDFVWLFPPWPIDVVVGNADIDDGEPERVELLDNEMVEGTGASTSGVSPAAFAVAGLNLSAVY